MTDPREALARINARMEEAAQGPDGAETRFAVAESQSDVPRLTEALESVLDLAAAWDAVADDMNGTAWPHDFRGNAIHAVTADMRDAITNAFNEEDH